MMHDAPRKAPWHPFRRKDEKLIYEVFEPCVKGHLGSFVRRIRLGHEV